MYVGAINSYTPVEYIESSGTQSIDTGVKPSSNIRTIVDFQFSSLPAATSQGLVGAWDANKGMIFGIQNNSGNLVFRFAFGTSAWAGSSIAADTNRHTVYMNDENGNGRLDNTTLANGSSATSLSYTYGMTLFSFMGSVTYKAHCKIYSCQMYENDTLIRDFIPVLDHNNVACMYEQVEEKFYYNKGTGVFTAGNVTGQPVIGESVAKNIPQAFVGISGVARKIKKGYVGVNGVARRFYWHFPYAYMPEADSGIVKTYVGNDYGIAKTANYIITVGGRKIANTNMNTTASEALNADGVLTTITNHAMRMPGGMEVNGNAVFCCGNSSTSSNSGSSSVVSYSNELVKTTLSNFGTGAYGVFPAANSVHGIRMGGNGYSTARNTVDILDNNLVRTSGTSLTTQRKANGTAAVGNYILTAAGSSSGNSSGGALKTVEAYDNNNVKTSATSLAEAAWYKTGISTKKYAIFYGGRLTNENGKSTNNFSYFNDNLVLTTIEFPYSCYNGVGLQIDDFILIGSGDVVETAGGSATYPFITYLFTEDLVRIKEISGPPSDASWTQRRYQLLGNRLYYEGYKTGFGYYKY